MGTRLDFAAPIETRRFPLSRVILGTDGGADIDGWDAGTPAEG